MKQFFNSLPSHFGIGNRFLVQNLCTFVSPSSIILILSSENLYDSSSLFSWLLTRHPLLWGEQIGLIYTLFCPPFFNHLALVCTNFSFSFLCLASARFLHLILCFYTMVWSHLHFLTSFGQTPWLHYPISSTTNGKQVSNKSQPNYYHRL